MKDILLKTPLFGGLDPKTLDDALRFYQVYQNSYLRGEVVHSVLSTMTHFGLVLKGTVQVYMDDIDGEQMIMANVSQGGIFGDSLCFLEKVSPVYIVAMTDCDILWLSTRNLKTPGRKTDFETDMSNRFTAMLASRALTMNDRIQILSKNSLRKKIITFFSQYMTQDSDVVTVPFDRESMATYLGVNRSALSRELSAMAEEGILSYRKNTFEIHHKMKE